MGDEAAQSGLEVHRAQVAVAKGSHTVRMNMTKSRTSVKTGMMTWKLFEGGVCECKDQAKRRLCVGVEWQERNGIANAYKEGGAAAHSRHPRRCEREASRVQCHGGGATAAGPWHGAVVYAPPAVIHMISSWPGAGGGRYIVTVMAIPIWAMSGSTSCGDNTRGGAL